MRPSAEVVFDESTLVTVKPKKFLSRSENKDRLISMLIGILQKRGHVALQADGDADTLICDTAINISSKGS